MCLVTEGPSLFNAIGFGVRLELVKTLGLAHQALGSFPGLSPADK